MKEMQCLYILKKEGRFIIGGMVNVIHFEKSKYIEPSILNYENKYRFR